MAAARLRSRGGCAGLSSRLRHNAQCRGLHRGEHLTDDDRSDLREVDPDRDGHEDGDDDAVQQPVDAPVHAGNLTTQL